MKALVLIAIALVVTSGVASAATPATVGDGWHAFITPAGTGVGGVPFQSPYTFTASAPVLVTVTDIFCIGDRFTISDGTTTLGTTSVPGPLDCRNPDTGLPDVALADPNYSHGRFAVTSGAHSIGIVLTTAPFGNASGYIRFDSMTAADCQNNGWQSITASPAFASEADCLSFVSVDTTPPVITVPGPITLDATSPAGAVVTYSVTATDPDDAVASLACAPPSGAVFAIGGTTVTCTATDTHGNTSSAGISVTIKGADSQLADLLAAVTGVGPGTSLADKVRVIQSEVAARDVMDACSTATALHHEMSAQTGRTIPTSQARGLIGAVEQIRAVLGCG